MTDTRHLHRCPPPAWNTAAAYRADPIEMLRGRTRKDRTPPSFLATLAADWREFAAEVADAPAHHALFGLLVVISWTVIIFAPLLIAERF